MRTDAKLIMLLHSLLFEASLRSILCSPDLPLPLAQLLTSITIKILKYHLVHPYGPLFNGKWISRRLQVDPYLTSIAKSLSTMASRSLAHTSNPDLQNALEVSEKAASSHISSLLTFIARFLFTASQSSFWRTPRRVSTCLSGRFSNPRCLYGRTQR